MCCHTSSLLTWLIALVGLPTMETVLKALSMQLGLFSKILLAMEIVPIRKLLELLIMISDCIM